MMFITSEGGGWRNLKIEIDYIRRVLMREVGAMFLIM
jgi:hypothetical protein